MKRKGILRKTAAILICGVLVAGCAKGEGAQEASQGASEEAAQASAEASIEVPEPKGTEEAQTYDPASFDPAQLTGETEHSAKTDLSGCDTFTQIVDKLAEGRGYTNTAIGDTDVLMVADDLYEWESGKYASTDAEIYVYKDGAPSYIGYVACGGTAYPLQIKDGVLYACGNHYMRKYTVRDNTLILSEEAYVNYDKDGNDTYYYRTEGGAFTDHDNVAAEEALNNAFRELDRTEVLFFDKIGGSASGALPAYEYPGPESFYTVLYKYLIDELSPHYDKAQVSIPCPVIIAEDESDKQDIRVYGNFWLFNYDLNGDILECVSGGSYPGCVHLKIVDTADGYEVTQMEVAEDGGGYTESAKRIFGEHYDTFVKDGEDEKKREELRAQIIANYAAANDLSIRAFKDYGWDPVELPKENIDSFYSILN